MDGNNMEMEMEMGREKGKGMRIEQRWIWGGRYGWR